MNTFAISGLHFIKFSITTLLLLFYCVTVAQPELPKRAISVRIAQPIYFGSFCLSGGSGGTVTVGYDGNRTSSGDIILLSVSPLAQPAIFEIKLCKGQNITIIFDTPVVALTGNGGSMSLAIGPTDRGGNGVSFPANADCNFTTQLRLGGTISVPGAARPGTYSGYFSLTFIQQ